MYYVKLYYMIRRFEKLFYFIFLCWKERFVSSTRALTPQHNDDVDVGRMSSIYRTIII